MPQHFITQDFLLIDPTVMASSLIPPMLQLLNDFPGFLNTHHITNSIKVIDEPFPVDNNNNDGLLEELYNMQDLHPST